MSAASNGRQDITPGESRAWDGVYQLLCAVHHAAEGCEVARRAAEDARVQGDTELASFFESLEQNSRNTIERAQQLLNSRRKRRGRLDTVAESSMESFPASDPPSSY